VRILTRSPVGHYRVPTYLRGKMGTVKAVIEPPPSTTSRKASA
jgi:nitrile hydratase